MKNSTAQSNQESSGKEKPNAKTFRIPISNGIFAHYSRLKDARWLLDLYVDWTTKEIPAADGSRDGLVLGGKPIRDEDTAVPFGCCARTTRRWRQRLARFGYIGQLRTPMGYVIRVKKSKKWPERPDKNVQSDRTQMSDQNYQVCPIRTTDHVRSNKDSAVQDRDVVVGDAPAAAAFSLKGKSRKVLKEAWESIGIEPSGSIRFCQAWEHFFGEPTDGALLSVVMERAIQHCQANGIRVPPPFFAAKRLIEKGDDEEEVSRIAGPRGVREELMR